MNKWNTNFEKKYGDFAAPYLRAYKQKIDCADLALACLVEFAYGNDLPLRFFYYNRGQKIPMDSQKFKKDVYRLLLKSQLNAHGVIDNTREIKLRDARPGDLLMTQRPTPRPWEDVDPNDPEKQRERMGRSRIVISVAYNRAKPKKSKIAFLNASYPPIIPIEETEPYENFTQKGDDLDPAAVHSLRRWNYVFFNTPQTTDRLVASIFSRWFGS